MNPILTDHLQPVVTRLAVRRICLTAGLVWLCYAFVASAALILNRWTGWYTLSITTFAMFGFALALILGLVTGAVSGLRLRRDHRWIANQVERHFPELDSCLITAVEQQPQERGRFGFMQQEVIRQAVYHNFRHPWSSLVPAWHLTGSFLLSVGAFMATVVSLLAVLFFFKIPANLPTILPFKSVEISQAPVTFSVEPGNTEIEKGTSLLVIARFASTMPPEAYLSYQTVDGPPQRVKMFKSLSDPVYAARVSEVIQPLNYRVELESQASDEFHVDVFEYPALQRADAKLHFPGYTGMTDSILQDVRRVSAVDGTELTVTFQLNKPVASAALTGEHGEQFPVTQVPTDPNRYSTTMVMRQSTHLELHLTDDRGRQNQFPPRLAINVLANQPTKIVIKSPGRDLSASPLEEVQLAAEVWDDFGVESSGLTYSIDGGTRARSCSEHRCPRSKTTNSNTCWPWRICP